MMGSSLQQQCLPDRDIDSHMPEHLGNRTGLARNWRASRILITAAFDALIFAGSGVVAFLLRFEFNIERRYSTQLFLAVIVWVTIKSVVFARARLSHIWSGHISVPDVVGIAVGNIV